MRLRKIFKAGSAAIALALVVTAFTAAPASAARRCHFAFSTGKFTCGNADTVRKPTDVIGARLFTGGSFTGDMLTVWMPRPCKKDDRYDGYLRLGDGFQNSISSVQGWAGCWVWLHFADGEREGPYWDDVPDVGTHANDRATHVGIS